MIHSTHGPQLEYVKRLRELSVEPGLPLVTDGATIRLAIDELARLQQGREAFIEQLESVRLAQQVQIQQLHAHVKGMAERMREHANLSASKEAGIMWNAQASVYERITERLASILAVHDKGRTP